MTKMCARPVLHPLAAAALLALGGTAFAQSTPADAASAVEPAASMPSSAAAPGKAASAAGPIETQFVYVTANRRRERVKDVAGAVDVLGGYQLERQNLTSVDDWSGFVTGLQVSGDTPSMRRETIRGITTGYLQIGATVATYLDDTPISVSSSLVGGALFSPDVDPLDVERIEVLKGPQGSLYGASALGGLIKYVTVTPNLKDVEGRAEVGYSHVSGGNGGASVRGAINVPLVKDVLASRLTVYGRKDPGYVDDPSRGAKNVNSYTNDGARLTTLFKPSTKFDAKLMLDTQTIKSPDAAVPNYDAKTLQPIDGNYGTENRFALPMKTVSNRDALTLNYDFGFANLLSVSSFARQKLNFRQDDSSYIAYVDFATAAALTGAGLPTSPLGVTGAVSVQDADIKKKVQEFRLTSVSGQTFEWLAGVFYQDELAKTNARYDVYTGTDLTTPKVPGWIADSAQTDMKETAVYANTTYHFTDSFDVQTGARLAKLRFTYSIPFLQTYSLVTNGPVLSAPEANDASEHKSTWLFSPRWKLDSDDMLYARAASGYRPGGPNTPNPGGAAKPPFHSDSIVNYEFGFKGFAPRAKIGVEATLYRINWKNIQLTGIDSATGYAYYLNGGKAHSQGIELTTTWQPLSGLNLSASLTTTQAKLDQDVTELNARSGDEVPFTAKVATALSADYSWGVGDGRASVGASFRHTGSRKAAFTSQNVSAFVPSLIAPTLPSYNQFDLRADYAWDMWTLSLFTKNALNSRGMVNYNAATVAPDLSTGGITPATVSVTTPRTIGVSLRADF
jgi:outer membrane receptor protein involved in Fe transport